LKLFRKQFAALDKRALRDGANTDHSLIENDIEIELWYLDDTRGWETDPSYYLADPFFSIFLLASREFAPPAERIRALSARLEQVPDLLASARANLKNPPHILTEIGIEEALGAIEFCETLIPQLALHVQATRRLERAVKGARSALRAFLVYLQDDLLLTSTGKLGIGARQYAKILKYEHMVPYSIAQVVAMGERVFRETERELAAWAKRIDRRMSWREIASKARSDFPARGRLLSAYRQEVRRLRDFSPPISRRVPSNRTSVDNFGLHPLTPARRAPNKSNNWRRTPTTCIPSLPRTRRIRDTMFSWCAQIKSARVGANIFPPPSLPKAGHCTVKN
jgi:hypothetical protein